MSPNNLISTAPMMTNDLGIRMVLHLSPCAPISMEPATIASLELPNVVASGMGSFCPMDLTKGMVYDEHSAMDLSEVDKAFETGMFLIDHDYAIEFPKNDITSNDTMIQNLKKLDVENSGSKGHSVSSTDSKHKKYMMMVVTVASYHLLTIFIESLPIFISVVGYPLILLTPLRLAKPYWNIYYYLLLPMV
ncbi:hypothetical protein Ancab_031520 [Ancistrocladus abbreviatus]